MTGAQIRAAAAATRVDTLTAEYLHRSREVADAVAGYSASFAAGTAASQARQRTVAELDAVLAARSRTVRAIYASGGTLTLSGSFLGARSVDEAIWRMDTTHRLFTQLLDRRGSELLAAERTAAQSRTAEQQAEHGRRSSALDLAALQREQQRADAALDQAQRVLAGLDRTVATLKVARDAASRLSAARKASTASHALPAPGASDIPSSFASAYRSAARTCPGLDWTLLAAVGQIETGHGRNNGPSSAGAIGPMQFMPATFARYAVDGDSDGRTDAWDTEDAVFSAARYLCASGAGQGPAGAQRALFAYNHAQWYVDLVLGAQGAVRSRFGD